MRGALTILDVTMLRRLAAGELRAANLTEAQLLRLLGLVDRGVVEHREEAGAILFSITAAGREVIE